MLRYVAFLRGIMPSNKNMSNKNLKRLFESLGFLNVSTVISSGNVLFESNLKDTKKIEAMIEKAVPKLGFKSTTIVKSKDQIKDLIDKNPFKGLKDDLNFRLNVTFLKNDQKITLKFPHKNQGFVILGIYDRTIFSSIDLSGTRTPEFMLLLEKQFGKEITTRTWKTVNRIYAKL